MSLEAVENQRAELLRRAEEAKELERRLSLLVQADRIRAGDDLAQRIPNLRSAILKKGNLYSEFLLHRLDGYSLDFVGQTSYEQESDDEKTIDAHRCSIYDNVLTSEIFIVYEQEPRRDKRTPERETLYPYIFPAASRTLVCPRETYKSLYVYQRECLAWLWSVHHSEMRGGVLADDMGLGKTVQISAYLGSLWRTQRSAKVILMAPVSVLPHWQNEILKWCPHVSLWLFHQNATTMNKRGSILRSVEVGGGILLTTYGMFTNNAEVFNIHGGWDYIILDEGHRIKNPDINLSRALRTLNVKHRIVLTGTPIQNSLDEVWSIFDFVTEGKLFGDRKRFNAQYTESIQNGSKRDATYEEVREAARCAKLLRKTIRPYFLRREKSLIQQDTNSTSSLKGLQKNDLILWIRLNTLQEEIYRKFLRSNEVKEALEAARNPLAQLTVLKKMCDHPQLLGERRLRSILSSEESSGRIAIHNDTQVQLDLLDSFGEDEEGEDDSAGDFVTSCKMEALFVLLRLLKRDNHHPLIFSQSKKLLDLVAKKFVECRWLYERIDGTIVSPDERQSRITRFNTDPKIFAFLLTTTAGGVGINLTAADRVIIFDPAWNPAVDNQAIDRAYREGQKNHVIVYRFITCGTVEEVIYRRQIFKYSLTNPTIKVSSASQTRYFSKKDLREVFSEDRPFEYSLTQQFLSRIHPPGERKSYPELQAHLDELLSLKEEMGLTGITDNDLMFTKDIVVVENEKSSEAGNPTTPEELEEKAPEEIIPESPLERSIYFLRRRNGPMAEKISSTLKVLEDLPPEQYRKNKETLDEVIETLQFALSISAQEELE